ncbi:Protein of unknown function DUF3468 [Penicillium italicum]|uniref:Uncharacterized protein n=1 Tax=Penicillium italicum TaxID=40296 RepID=A0A0A2KIZ5_PENIT|nr:Protein of unknown function DUF3468 [Penicillium italicum]
MPFKSPFGSLAGITPTTLQAITKTEELAETIEAYEWDNLPVPKEHTRSITQLSNQLQEFQPADDMELNFYPGLDARRIINNNLEVAWYLAACIYFHNRLLKTFNDDIPINMGKMLKCLFRAEEIKEWLEPDLMKRDAPVIFPAFLGACNSSDRDSWFALWSLMQEYEHLNITGKWMAVKAIWNEMDKEKKSWVGVVKVSDENPLRLSDFFGGSVFT